LVLAYIDIGQAEEWRWYWDGHPTYEDLGECKPSFISQIQTWAPWVIACDPDGWAGNYPVAYWDPAWKNIVIYGTTLGAHLGLYFNSFLDEVIQDGFDGIYLDWVEAWEMDEVKQRAQNEGKDPGLEMLKFIQEMRTYGKQYNPNFLVIQQNSSELINEVGASSLWTAVDAIAQEGIWWEGSATDNWNDPDGYDQPSGYESYYLPRLRMYKAAGFPVFNCEYAVSKANDAFQKAKSEGFVAYATRRSLSRLTTTPPFLYFVLLGTWDSTGVWYWNSETEAWIYRANPAISVSGGDFDGDGITDLSGVWDNGFWVRYSSSGTWSRLTTSLPESIASGDINGDGRDDIVATWQASGVWHRDSVTGSWVKHSSAAELIAAGDLDGDHTDDLIGVWASGLWVRYSLSGAWLRLTISLPEDIASGDMNGDGRDDVLATWNGSGVWYRDSIGGGWVKMSTAADLVTAGDVDGDHIDDLIGVWSSGLWVKASSTMDWERLTLSLPQDIASGCFRGSILK
jgi:cysteinyl-tRNA synthetase